MYSRTKNFLCCYFIIHGPRSLRITAGLDYTGMPYSKHLVVFSFMYHVYSFENYAGVPVVGRRQTN